MANLPAITAALCTLCTRRPLATAAAMIAVACILAGTAVRRKSVTVDEFQALPHGLFIISTGQLHIDAGVPPLSKVLGALPVLAMRPRTHSGPLPEGASSFMLGWLFARDNAENYHAYFQPARQVSLLFFAATCLLAWEISRRLYGPWGGFLTLTLAAFCPNLLAHGALATSDIFFTAATIWFLLAMNGFLRRPGIKTAALVGGVTGIACLFKFTGLLFFGIAPMAAAAALWLAGRQPQRDGLGELAPGSSPGNAWRNSAIFMLAALLTALLVINAGYGFAGSFTPLGDFDFQSGAPRLLQRLLPGWLPMPVPYQFLRGIDVQMAESGYVSYLLGQVNTSGFPHYYIVAFLVKTSTPLLLLSLAAVVLPKPRLRAAELPVLLTFGAAFLVFSFVGHKNIGIRYLLFGFPILAICCGRLASNDWGARAWPRRLAVAACLWHFTAALACWPNYLTFFNEISGGPGRGHRYLLDSNLDWGQDLPALRDYMREHKIALVDLAYFGRVPPEVYGIRYRFLGEMPPARHLAISANLLWGRYYFVNGSDRLADNPDTFASLRQLRPKAILNHTIYVFEDADPAAVGGILPY